MSKPELHEKYQQAQLFRLDQAVYKMGLEGIPELSTPFQAVLQARGLLRLNLGFKIPKPVFSLLSLYGLSPGTITVWMDSEKGYFTEARAKPGAPPIRHFITDEVAMTILKGELTHELEGELMTPDTYIGE